MATRFDISIQAAIGTVIARMPILKIVLIQISPLLQTLIRLSIQRWEETMKEYQTFDVN